MRTIDVTDYASGVEISYETLLDVVATCRMCILECKAPGQTAQSAKEHLPCNNLLETNRDPANAL